MERLRTGIPEADRILHGGFPVHSINVVMGSPGTGKTIFIQQLAWHNATGDRPVLYCTTLSEPLSKLVRYLQELDFFDPSRIGSSILYDDLGEPLTRQGLTGLCATLRDRIQDRKPSVLVIDSFKAAQELANSEQDVRRATFELAGLLSAYDVTSFLVGEYHDREIRDNPVFAAADGIVEMSRVASDRRDERYLRVLKLRGSDYLQGRHGFEISSSGLSIHPRLPPPTPPRREAPGDPAPPTRIPTGVPGLDLLTGGGLPDRGSTLFLGSAGSGKTTMAMQFLLEGARRGEDGRFVGLQESPEQLERLVRRLDPDLGERTRDRLEIWHRSPVELKSDGLVGEMLRAMTNGRPARLVLDTLDELALSGSAPRRLQDGVYSLVQAAAANGVALLLTANLNRGRDVSRTTRMHHLMDDLIVVDEDPEDRERLRIRVRKCRHGSHERSERTLELWERGARVLAD